jgi:hypothetical protein
VNSIVRRFGDTPIILMTGSGLCASVAPFPGEEEP